MGLPSDELQEGTVADKEERTQGSKRFKSAKYVMTFYM